MNDDSVFKAINVKKISLWIWILLKFKKSHIGTDSFELGKDKHIYVTYAKKVFGKIYITKTEHYVNGKLCNSVKLKRIKEYPITRGASIRYQSIDELI